MRIVLASSSPRRCELMKLLERPFEVIVKNQEEKIDKTKNCYEQCMLLAKEKAQGVFNDISGDVIVIGSDTVVIYNNEIYGKPKSKEEAKEMIEKFSNNQHEVVSSLCLLIRKNNQCYEELTYDECKVFVNKMTNDEIEDWVNNHDCLTRAGAYAIQDGFCKYITKIEGDYYSIVGLPIYKLYNLIKKYW